MRAIYLCPACKKWQLEAEESEIKAISQEIAEHWTGCLEEQVEDLTRRLL
jgi:hypothetical protein